MTQLKQSDVPLTHALAALLEDVEASNLMGQVGALSAMGAVPEAHCLTIASATVALTRAEFGRKLNHIVGVGLHEALDEAALAAMEMACRSVGCAVEIDLCPFADEQVLPLLAARGYAVNDFTGTYVHWHVDQPAPWPALPDGVHIRPVTEDEHGAVADWAAIGFAAQSHSRDPGLSRLLARSALHRRDTQVLVAEIDVQVDGTAALSMFDIQSGAGGLFAGSVRCAHLHMASSLPHARGRGVQTALLTARLALAAQAGVRIATITARSTGASGRNALRAGFALAYTNPTLALALA